MNENDKRVKEMLEEENIPQELEPENIKKMLDEKAPQKKRGNIRRVSKITAMAAACALVCGTAAYLGTNGNILNGGSPKNLSSGNGDDESGSTSRNSKTKDGKETKPASDGDAITENNGAESYDEIYSYLKKSSKKYKKLTSTRYSSKGNVDISDDVADGDAIAETNEESNTASLSAQGGKGGADEHSDTFNQEEGVLESDIVKTDGRFIYRAANKYDEDGNYIPSISIVEAENGKLLNKSSIDIVIAPQLERPDYSNDSDDVYYYKPYGISTVVSGMYIYNDMLVVVSASNEWSEFNDVSDTGEYNYSFKNNSRTVVQLYTTGLEPQLIGSYSQDGYYSDVRISPDGYLYLVTSYSSYSFDNIGGAENTDNYIPSWNLNEGEETLVAADCITLPDIDISPSSTLSYTVVGSIDLNDNTECVPTDIKAFAGYSGTVYCSAENMYTTCGWENTEITRIAIDSGTITPAASGEVVGYVNDQFSMSEYDGYFRIAVTDISSSWTEDILYDYFFFDSSQTDNDLYVLDMDMNIVGSLKNYGKGETIKSVNYDGDRAYVVTYEQTDPLFAIDLSDPTDPTITSELKALGFSTYMQKWDDTHLLGIGISADENGIQDGFKITMYDSSDPSNITSVGEYIIPFANDYDDYSSRWSYSPATYERKAALIAPEKDLIGIPLCTQSYVYYYEKEDGYNYTHDYDSEITSEYLFFKYTDGEFELIGNTEYHSTDINSKYMDRALYIGDYVYTISDSYIIAADAETITETDRLDF